MNRWVPDNTHPDHSSHVTEVPITPNVCKLKNEKGRIVRKQENSHAEVYGVLATYCPCDGGDPTIIMDPYCGTGVLCLGGIRQNVTGIYMNDQDGNCVDLARGRALEYFVGCREVGFIIPDGNGGWKAVQPTRAEIDFQAMYAIGRILQDRKAKPGNNYPLEYKRNHDGLNTRCLAANVFVAESTIKAGAKGLFAKMPFLEGTDVVPFIGKLHYDEELTKVSKHPERLWNSADESLATALEGCIYSPATFVQNGSDGKTLGTGAATFPNLKVKINENLSLSDSGRYTYVTTRPVKATEELFADFTTPFFEFRKAAMDKKKRRQSASKRSRVSNDDDTDDDDEVPITGVNNAEEDYIDIMTGSPKKKPSKTRPAKKKKVIVVDDKEEDASSEEDAEKDIEQPPYSPNARGVVNHTDGFKSCVFVDDMSGVSKSAKVSKHKKSNKRKSVDTSSSSSLSSSSSCSSSSSSSQQSPKKVPNSVKALQSHLTTPSATSKRRTRGVSKK